MSEAQIRAIATAAAQAAVNAALSKLVITGPGVSGNAATGWVVNIPPATATCNDDGTILITFG